MMDWGYTQRGTDTVTVTDTDTGTDPLPPFQHTHINQQSP